MRRTLTTLCLTIAVLLGSAGVSFALPPCPEDPNQGFHNCFGTNTTADGDKYVGEFRDGNYHGQGTITCADGTKYVGEYRDNKRHGQGSFTFSSGEKYVGEFRDNKRHGQGTFTFADGRVEEGVWENDEFQYARKGPPPVIAEYPPSLDSSPGSDPDEVVAASSGSGFAVSSDGYVITNHRVIDGCQKVQIHHKVK